MEGMAPPEEEEEPPFFVELGARPEPTLTRPGRFPEAFGAAVVALGDVDGDGYDDLAVGAPEASFDGCTGGCGRVYVYRGTQTGVEAEPVSTINGVDLAGGGLGVGLAALGDVNGDDRPDLAVSDAQGRVYILAAGAAGLPSGGVERIAVRVIEPPEGFDHVGLRLEALGDLDGDGLGELGVWARGDVRKDCLGVNTLIYGLRSSLFVYSEALEEPLLRVDWPDDGAGGCDCQWAGGTSRHCNFSATAIATDLDGDDYPELLVSSDGVNGGRGRVHVYPGGASGLALQPASFFEGACENAELGWSIPREGMTGDALVARPDTGEVLAVVHRGCGEHHQGHVALLSEGNVQPYLSVELDSAGASHVERIALAETGLLSASIKYEGGRVWLHPREEEGFGTAVPILAGEAQDAMGMHLLAYSPTPELEFAVVTALGTEGVWLVPLR